jgi:hypothetical protein
MYQRDECLAHASTCREKAQADPALCDYWIDQAAVWLQPSTRHRSQTRKSGDLRNSRRAHSEANPLGRFDSADQHDDMKPRWRGRMYTARGIRAGLGKGSFFRGLIFDYGPRFRKLRPARNSSARDCRPASRRGPSLSTFPSEQG